MNILFFLTPKSDVAYIYDDFSVRQALEKLEYYQYSAIPILDREGHYIGTLTEGDILRLVKKEYDLSLHDAENIKVSSVRRRRKVEPITIDSDVEDLFKIATQQNFVPVVDDSRVFIGIITRKAIISYGLDRLREIDRKDMEKEEYDEAYRSDQGRDRAGV